MNDATLQLLEELVAIVDRLDVLPNTLVRRLNALKKTMTGPVVRSPDVTNTRR